MVWRAAPLFWRLGLTVAVCLGACRPPPPKAPARAPAPAYTGPEVKAVRENLQVTPLEAVFSAVRGTPGTEENVAVRNNGSEPIEVATVEIVGRDPTVFKITSGADKLPISLVPGSQVSVSVVFSPPVDATPGVHRAMLRVLVGPNREEGPPVDLSGLVMAGKGGEKEPSLQQILEALGFQVDVGADLKLGTDPTPLGDEVKVSRFRRANAGNISIYPVARFSANERLPYGYYTGEEGPQPHPLGAVAADQDQTLNPDLEPDALTTFDPGDQSFGVFVNLGKRYGYTEDRMNSGPIRHTARVFSLKSRLGHRIPDAYAVAFESAGVADYQDLVFMIWNVKPAE